MRFVKFFFANPLRLLFALGKNLLKSCFIYRLIIQAGHGAKAKGIRLIVIKFFVKLTWSAGLSPSFEPFSYIIGDVSLQKSFLFTNNFRSFVSLLKDHFRLLL